MDCTIEGMNMPQVHTGGAGGGANREIGSECFTGELGQGMLMRLVEEAIRPEDRHRDRMLE